MNAVKKYASAAKGEYRESLWTALALGRPTGHALILTGPEGREIPVLRQRGFQDHQMHLVDRISAYPLMARDLHGAAEASNYYGDVEDVIDTMRQRGVALAYANIDLCCTVMNVLPVAHKVVTTAEVFAGARVAFTWIRARDNHYTGFLMRLHKVNTRAALVQRVIQTEWPKACFIGGAEYSNGKGGPMEWGAWELRS